MALKSSGDRLANYNSKLIPARVAEDLTAKKASMVAVEAVIFNQMTDIEDRTRGVLSSETTLSVDYPKYYCFAKQVWKLQRKLGGGTALMDEVALVLAKWQARGCTNAILTKIRNDIFAISAPTPPGP